MSTSDIQLIDQAVAQAAATADAWAESSATVRAKLLRGLADALEQHQQALITLADEETGLGAGRLTGEVARTAFQLRGFADEVEAGVPFSRIDDQAIAGPPPAGRPRLTRVSQPLGPVAMFSASNFPFAFSVLGGDTASALAAGCPVVVKAHSGHPRLSRAVHEVAQGVLAEHGLPSGFVGLGGRRFPCGRHTFSRSSTDCSGGVYRVVSRRYGAVESRQRACSACAVFR